MSADRLPVLVDGEATQWLPVTDRALHYGDGHFTTIAVHSGEPLLWSRHRARLDRGCARLAIPPPDWRRLADDIQRLAAASEQAVIKVIISRGDGQRGYRPASGPCRRIVSRHPWPQWPASHWTTGIDVRPCRTRLAEQGALAGIKHLNRLEQVLARAEWQDPGFAEGLQFDSRGRPISGTMSNLWIVRQGTLLTPMIETTGIAGVMRGLLLDIARGQGIPCRTAPLSSADLTAADEMFFSNALIGIWPVRRYAGADLLAAGGIARGLLTALTERSAICPPPAETDR